jgi:hypothetical protein
MWNCRVIFRGIISTNALAKLGRNENVRVDVLVKICGIGLHDGRYYGRYSRCEGEAMIDSKSRRRKTAYGFE